MRVAITGATGFLGRYIVEQLAQAGHTCRCWHRETSDTSGFDLPAGRLEWVPGQLDDPAACGPLVEGCDAVVHAALHRPGSGFTGSEGSVPDFARINIIGTLQLIEAARAAGAGRFIFISTCAVHDHILPDRTLDEAHPLWPNSHYGAHKAAIEKFIHSYGLGGGYDICSLRPTGIYGVAHPIEKTRWLDLVRRVAAGDTVECKGGGKEVHAADVAKAVELLLTADGIAGQAYNCYDRYISDYDMATLAKDLTGSDARIEGEQRRPKNQIDTTKLRKLGMNFGGDTLLERTVKQMLAVIGERKR